MGEKCYICGRTCDEVADYLRGMLKDYQGRSFDGLYFGPFQNCLNNMKSLMYLNRNLEQRNSRLKAIRDRIAGLEQILEEKRTDDPSIVKVIEVCRVREESVLKEIGETEEDIGRKQKAIDEFLEIGLTDYQTKSGYIIRLCPICLSIVSESRASKDHNGQ